MKTSREYALLKKLNVNVLIKKLDSPQNYEKYCKTRLFFQIQFFRDRRVSARKFFLQIIQM